MQEIILYDEQSLSTLHCTSVFGTYNFLASQSDQFGAIKSQSLHLFFYVKSVLGIKRLTFTAFEAHDSLSEESFNVELNFILKKLKKDLNISFITCPPSYVIFPYKVNIKGCTSAEFGTVKNNLTLSEEALFKNLHGKHRNVIRKAEKDNIQFEYGPHLREDCYELIKSTLDREHVYFESHETFCKTYDSLANQVEYFVVKKNNEIHGAAIIPFDKRNAFYLLGGSPPRPSTGAMNFMHWKIMMYFKAMDVKSYDFVGIRLNPSKDSKLYGIKRFKIRFGGDVESGFLWKANLKPFQSFLFKLLYLAKNRSLPKDIIESVKKA